MVLQLAEKQYDDPYLLEDMLMGRFTTPITVERERRGRRHRGAGDPRDAAPARNVVLRGASIQLVALLESGDLDCAFEYESVARQHGLEYVRLPAAVDLGDEDLRDDVPHRPR